MESLHLDDISGLMPQVPSDAIVSRTVYDGPDAKVVLFGFAAGQSLSEHTASRPALLHLLSGRADVVLGAETVDAGPGFWARMEARLPHSVLAREPTVLLLVLLGPS